MLIYKGKSKENLKTFVIDWLSADWSWYSCMICLILHLAYVGVFTSLHQNSLVLWTVTLHHWLFLRHVLPLSGIEWSMRNAKRGYAGGCRRGVKVWPVSSWMYMHVSTHSPLHPPLWPTHTSLSAHHLYLPVTDWSDLAIYPCHMMYCGNLYGPLGPLRCSHVMMASHTHPAMQ
jgi:hypothetical protein